MSVELVIIFTVVGVLISYWLFQQGDKLHTLKGKRVVVTGASDGIGKQIAFHYARLGAQVVVTARRLQILNEVVKECQALSPSPNVKHFAVQADMSNMNETKKVIEQATKHMGGLDILVLNHITSHDLHLWETTPSHLDEFDFILDVNTRSYIHMATHALPHLQVNGGNIIVVNSLVGKTPHPALAAYSASKHALNGFFSSLQAQFQMYGQNISVTTCHLGVIGTDNSLKTMTKAGLKLNYMPPASPPSETALDIVKAGAAKRNEAYSPYYSVRMPLFMYHALPSFVYQFTIGSTIGTTIQLKEKQCASN